MEYYYLKEEEAVKKRGQEKMLKSPRIEVKEISRLLINLKKKIQNDKERHWIVKDHCIDLIKEVRTILELRRRSREGLNVQKNIRSVRQVHRKAK